MSHKDHRSDAGAPQAYASSVSFGNTLSAMVLVWAGLVAWSMLADRAGCVGSALFLLACWVLIGAAGAEAVLLKRASLIGQYLEPRGRLFRWLRRPLLLLLWQAAKGLALALVILVAALGLTWPQWAVLFTDAVLLAILVASLDRVLGRELIPSYRSPLVRLWSRRLNAVLLWLALVAVAYYTPHEDYQGVTWQTAMERGALDTAASCDAVAALARAGGALEALAWWAAQQVLGGAADADAQQISVAWLAFLAAFGVSFIIAWAFSLALTGILALPLRMRMPSA